MLVDFALKVLTLCPLSGTINLKVMPIYSTKEAAERLGLSPDHVREPLIKFVKRDF